MIQLYQVSSREEKSHLRTHREAEGKDSQERKTLVWAMQCGAALGGESQKQNRSSKLLPYLLLYMKLLIQM